ncbi:phosphate/phosphite/phosphonate ABC transporter substrate-binding protein [Halobacteriales archaeon SW_6_65_15]|jgi:phosphonate transport system substrate-binding protein|nr:MAG: phosphate/phosphite/phosphonate ABC transporter substrate-binding protein [Halobacteriales archaeon SW_6_65_15]
MTEKSSRRKFLIGTTATITTAIAGYPGGVAAQETTTEGGSDGQSFDFPVTTDVLLDAGFETGNIEDLEQMEEREEPRYGNPVQETPSDEGELIDPDPITFSLAPTEDPAVYRDTMQPLLDNIAEETGKEVEFFPLNSYAAQVEAMRSERLHIGGFSTGTVPFAVNLAGAVPFSIQVSQEGDFGYRLWAITQADNDEINSVEDFAGKTVAHTEPTSNSGNLAPRAIFKDRFGITPDEDYEVEFSGGHQQSALGVANRDYEAAPVCSTCFARVADAGQLDPAAIKCVFASRPFPTTGFCYRYNLTPELQEGIRAGFLDYDYSDTPIAEQFEGRGVWTEIDYATVWDVILTIQEENGVEYEEGEIGG